MYVIGIKDGTEFYYKKLNRYSRGKNTGFYDILGTCHKFASFEEAYIALPAIKKEFKPEKWYIFNKAGNAKVYRIDVEDVSQEAIDNYNIDLMLIKGLLDE